MIPNSVCELLLLYLSSNIKKPSFLAQNLSFCQFDIWDSVLLINCPGKEVFEFILKRREVLKSAISKRLKIKLIHIRWQKEVIDIPINKEDNYSLGELNLAAYTAQLVKRSAKPVLAAKPDGQILFAYPRQISGDFLDDSIRLSSTELSRLAEAVESHGWVNGYRLKLDSNKSKGILTTVRARYTKDRLLNLVLLIQVLDAKSLEVVLSRDIA